MNANTKIAHIASQNVNIANSNNKAEHDKKKWVHNSCARTVHFVNFPYLSRWFCPSITSSISVSYQRRSS